MKLIKIFLLIIFYSMIFIGCSSKYTENTCSSLNKKSDYDFIMDLEENSLNFKDSYNNVCQQLFIDIKNIDEFNSILIRNQKTIDDNIPFNKMIEAILICDKTKCITKQKKKEFLNYITLKIQNMRSAHNKMYSFVNELINDDECFEEAEIFMYNLNKYHKFQFKEKLLNNIKSDKCKVMIDKIFRYENY